MSIYDTMQYIKADVSTICMGQGTCSMGAFLLSAGAKGKRICLPQLTCHDPPTFRWIPRPSDRYSNPRSKKFLKVKSRMNELMAQHTGKSIEEIERDT